MLGHSEGSDINNNDNNNNNSKTIFYTGHQIQLNKDAISLGHMENMLKSFENMIHPQYGNTLHVYNLLYGTKQL